MDKTILRLALPALMAATALTASGVAHAQVSLSAGASASTPAVAPAPVAPAPAPAAAPAAAPAPAPMAEPAPAPMPEPMAAPAPEAAAPEAAPAAPSTTLGGYISAGYTVNFTDTGSKHQIPLNPYNPSGHTFMLHSAHLNLDHKFSDSLMLHIGLDAGQDAVVNEYNYAPIPKGLFDVQEAYGAYTSGTWTLTAGKFDTYEGIEVVGAPSNPTVTHGLLYYYVEPIYHTGFKVHTQASDMVNVGLGVVNGWDNLIDNNGMKTIIGAVKLTPTTTSFVQLSASFGSEQANNKDHRLSVDITGSAPLSDAFTLNFQGNFGMQPHAGVGADAGKSASWFGLGVQPVYTSGDFTFGSRLEWLDAAQGFTPGGAPGKASYIDVTLTPGYKITDGFKLRADLRADIATEKVLIEKGGAKKAQFLSEVAAEFTF